jgi:Anti-sigma-28 factor, FlgM
LPIPTRLGPAQPMPTLEPMAEHARIQELREAVASGRYEVDARAVADAMLRRRSVSAVLVARELDRPAAGTDEDEAGPGADGA